jgi:choloylglycine hydrolase
LYGNTVSHIKLLPLNKLLIKKNEIVMKFNFKIILALIITLNLIGANALACTGIVLRAKDGSVVPARTMEFGFDIHSNILVIPAGTKITKLIMDENTTGGSYTTKYGLVGANALGKPIVVDGINEKGLYFGAFYFNHLPNTKNSL